MSELGRIASSCVFPGFEGPTVPDWIRRRIEEGLGGVVLYAWNVESREQLRALTDDLRSERDDLVIAIDEEGGDVTPIGGRRRGNSSALETQRWGSSTTSSSPSASPLRSAPNHRRGRREPRLRTRRGRQHESPESGDRDPLLRIRRRARRPTRRRVRRGCKARAWPRARSTFPVTATRPSTPTSRCRSSTTSRRRRWSRSVPQSRPTCCRS